MRIIKMHVCGDDYLLTPFDNKIDYSSLAIKILNRNKGIGANRLVVCKNNPLEIIIYDNLGKRELFNVNALICFAKYIYDNGLSKTNDITILTGAGRTKLEITQEIPFMARINLDKPNFNNRMIYVTDSLDSFGRMIKIDNTLLTIYSFNLLGVNTILFVDSFNESILNMAKAISEYKIFNRKTDVLFVKVIDKKNLQIKCYKPGIGFINSNGSACGAALVAASKLSYIRGKVTCHLDEGYMNPEIDRKGNVYVDIPVDKIFECDYNEEDI